MELRLPATGTLDASHALAVLALHSLPAQERLDPAAAQVQRILHVQGHLVEISLRLDAFGVSLTHDAPPESVARLTGIINHWLGLQQDTSAAYAALGALPGYQPLAMAFPTCG